MFIIPKLDYNLYRAKVKHPISREFFESARRWLEQNDRASCVMSEETHTIWKQFYENA